MKVLILDGGNQNTLAVVRYLGRAGHRMHVAAYSPHALSLYSKYCAKKIILPDPRFSSQEFIERLIENLKQEKFDILLPMGFRSYQLCATHAAQIRQFTKLIITSPENIAIASDKRKTYELAAQAGVPFPKTYQISSTDELEKLDISFPAVIKSCFESGKNIVEYAQSRDELIKKYQEMINRYHFGSNEYPLIQEYIAGDGYGFFAYYEGGVCKAYFMHHRIREYPATGGVSVCAESFYDEKLMEYGKRLLDMLRWEGVAMVEFKKHSNGEYKLMEINPKFWGSLELALAAGVNFPDMLLRRASGELVSQQLPYKNVTFQWLLNGELFHLIERPSSFFSIVKTLFYSKTDFYWSDLMPHVFQLANIFRHYVKKQAH
ncbi:MAG: ATP-grasp domain-containing protein [Chitinophagales bacterium]|nr:ATP-grasp domain-containing protein [Chitinophagales bacterium]